MSIRDAPRGAPPSLLGLRLRRRAPGRRTRPSVKFATSAGDFVVEVYPDKAPKTVENFLQYVRDKHYDGTIFHRVIDNFMIQGGGFDREHGARSRPARRWRTKAARPGQGPARTRSAPRHGAHQRPELGHRRSSSSTSTGQHAHRSTTAETPDAAPRATPCSARW